MASDEIDLYGNIEDDYIEESNDYIELYDEAVGSPKTTNQQNDIPEKVEQTSKYSGLRVSAYVGNLTWWTTDVDLKEAFKSIGVDDIVEIKFYENRQNGQSKGFCVVIFASHHSLDLAKTALPNTEIHGNNPIVANYNRANLSLFDTTPSNDHGNSNSSNHHHHHNNNNHNNSHHSHGNKTFNSNTNTIFNNLRNQQSFNSGLRSSGNPLNANNLNLPPPTFSGPTTFLPTTSIPPPGLNPLAINLPIIPNPTNLRLNPMQRPMLDNFGRGSHDFKISESEFEDIMNRNKTVASTAIQRAVQDASFGDISNAISTLRTAISLIKQSKISDDDRCKLLLNSLNDTLSGIEPKSSNLHDAYLMRRSSYKSSKHRRSYSRSDSDDGHHRRSQHKSRSRSRDRRESRGSRRYRDDRGSSGRVEYFGSSSGSNPSGRNYR